MKNFELRQNVHAEFRDLLVVDASIHVWVIEEFFKVEMLKQVWPDVRHHYFSVSVAELAREDKWEASIVL